jgi:hypothetical protein
MFTYRQLLARKYRDEETDGTDGAAAASAADDSTVLTGDADATASSTDTDSNAGADASADDAAASDDSQGDSDAGAEGSDVVPDAYADFTMPEGMQIDEAALTEAIPVFKELGLTQEQAQKVTDLQAKLVQAGSEKQVNDFNQLMSDWRTQTENDSEIGGDNFNENVKVAQAAITKYGTPELKQLLEEQGVGNHPEVVRFMVRVGKTLKEDVPGSPGTAVSQAQSRVDLLYPNDS